MKPQVTWEAEKGAHYSLIMIDADLPSRATTIRTAVERKTTIKYRDLRLWTVMNIPESSTENGDEIVEYLGPAPLKRTGLHRIIFLVYKQPNGFIRHTEKNTSNRYVQIKTEHIIYNTYC